MAQKFVRVDCCPVDTRLAPVLVKIKNKIGCSYQSVYRGQAPGAQKYLTGAAPCFKHNQAWIYAHYPPGVANPPGRSTHEQRNDGVAYRGWVGMPLPWWCCGMDIDDAHVGAFIREAAREGYTATITYPGSRVEYHHVNFRKAPKLPRPPLKLHSRGRRVKYVTGILSKIHSPTTHKPYLPYRYKIYKPAVEKAVRQFQIDHHQKPDGIYGPQTARQLARSWRWWKQNHGRK